MGWAQDHRIPAQPCHCILHCLSAALQVCVCVVVVVGGGGSSFPYPRSDARVQAISCAPTDNVLVLRCCWPRRRIRRAAPPVALMVAALIVVLIALESRHAGPWRPGVRATATCGPAS